MTGILPFMIPERPESPTLGSGTGLCHLLWAMSMSLLMNEFLILCADLGRQVCGPGPVMSCVLFSSSALVSHAIERQNGFCLRNAAHAKHRSGPLVLICRCTEQMHVSVRGHCLPPRLSCAPEECSVSPGGWEVACSLWMTGQPEN